MIVARFSGDGPIIIGLNREEIASLKRGEAVDVNLTKLGIHADAMVVHEDTDQKILDKLRRWITKKTKMVEDDGAGHG